uniref:Condensin complex subunit 1 n=1 Tax=Glossina brevipalpis TaxID=37001 RepID=A0A1A9WR39_9MUSC
MDFEFSLPLRSADLLHSVGNSYYVKHSYTQQEISENLKVCNQMLIDGDLFYLYDYFDTYYAVIENKNMDMTAVKNLMRAFDLLYQTVSRFSNYLATFFGFNELPSPQQRTVHLNLTKMSLYLLVNAVHKIDGNIARLRKEQENKGRKGYKHLEILEEYFDWDVKRVKFLRQLFNIMQYPLEKLWNPPLAEESFVNMLCEVCYRTLELLHVRNNNFYVAEIVFQILGTAIKHYNHGLNFSQRIVQILRTVEHAVSCIAYGFNILHEKDFHIFSVFSSIITKIAEALSVDSVNTIVIDNFSKFLTELADIAPKLLIPHLPALGDGLLNSESHVMRSCILHMMGNALVIQFSSQQITEEIKEACDNFLENLLMHINDISAHVRVKALQIWLHLKKEEIIPYCFQLKVLYAAIDRLEDKVSSVRKQASQLIKEFLERNPSGVKVALAKSQEKHFEESVKKEKLPVLVSAERKEEEFEGKWKLVVPKIMPFVEEIAKLNKESPEVQGTYKDLVRSIKTTLFEESFQGTLTLTPSANQVDGDAMLRRPLNGEEQCAYYLDLLKSQIFLCNGYKNTNDFIKFSKAISKAIPKMEDMLLSETKSDVLEAIEFFAAASVFANESIEINMRQILHLVWSSDEEKREAVCDAYKKVLFTTYRTGRAHALHVVQNLSRFLENLEYSDYSAMECLVKKWVHNEIIDGLIIQVLVERFTLKVKGTTENESRLALQLLIMCSYSRSSIIATDISIIESIDLGMRGQQNPRIYSTCLEFLLNFINQSLTISYCKKYETHCNVVQKIDKNSPDVSCGNNVAELINQLCEEVLLRGQNAVTPILLPYVVEICICLLENHDSTLQEVASLALIRFMCLSSRVCEFYMPFLMNILTCTRNIKIKRYIMIGLSELTFRFPNIVEPWADHFFSTLHDNNTDLRLIAVKILSHLPVKSQLADLAICIVDDDNEIKNITRQFFKEIADKSDILYNELPDIISKLRDTRSNLEEQKYRTVMRYILGLIQKDLQVENLVEKLCLCFPATHGTRRWRDIAYCLSLLSYNEKALKKLIDNMQHFKDKVAIDGIYQSFKLIISNTLDLRRPELKALIAKLESCLNKLEAKFNLVLSSLLVFLERDDKRTVRGFEESIFEDEDIYRIYAPIPPASTSTIVPGTKWCGPGNIAANYNDLGSLREVDMCCRDHDHCEDVIMPDVRSHDLYNSDWFPIMKCSCEQKFINCLQEINSPASNSLGHFYFVGRDKCFQFGHPIVECTKYQQGIVRKRCIVYKVDTYKSKIWQLYNIPFYTSVGEAVNN